MSTARLSDATASSTVARSLPIDRRVTSPVGGTSLRPCARWSSATHRNSSPRSDHCSRHVVMSRLNPWENSRSGASGGPAARTASFVPSNASTGPRSSGGGAHVVAAGRPSAAPERPSREAGGDGPRRDARRDDRGPLRHRYRLGTRSPILLTISYPIVPNSRPSASASMVSSPWFPISTTSSPTRTSASPPSTMI